MNLSHFLHINAFLAASWQITQSNTSIFCFGMKLRKRESVSFEILWISIFYSQWYLKSLVDEFFSEKWKWYLMLIALFENTEMCFSVIVMSPSSRGWNAAALTIVKEQRDRHRNFHAVAKCTSNNGKMKCEVQYFRCFFFLMQKWRVFFNDDNKIGMIRPMHIEFA